MNFKRDNLRLLEDQGRVLLERTGHDDYEGLSLDMAELRWLLYTAGPAILSIHDPLPDAPVLPGKASHLPFDLHIPDPIPGQETLEVE